MKKALEGIIGVWRTVASWLAKWGADRWMHLVAGLALAYYTAVRLFGWLFFNYKKDND